jgi:predicted nucleic acid-binding protein
MTSAFLDTGYVIALEAADDQYHDAAVQHWRGFIAQLSPLVTTSYVFDEVVTFFNTALAFDQHFVQAGFEKLP